MAQIGPLAKVATIVAIITLDLSRKLNWGKNLVMRFLVPDMESTSIAPIAGLTTVATITKGFDRMTLDETTRGDGRTVIYKVADKSGTLLPTLKLKDLHIEVDGVVTTVAEIPPVGPNEAQVYTLTCKIRTLKTTFEKR